MVDFGENTFAWFTRNPRGGNAKDIELADVEKLQEILKKEKFGTLVAHASYTMNLCSAKPETRANALDMLKQDLKRMEQVPGQYYNFHPGSHTGQGTETGIQQIGGRVMTKKLLISALIKSFSGVLLVGLLLFPTAGSFDFWQAWLFMAVLFIPMFVAGLILMKKNPSLLRKRLNVKEEQLEQKEVVLFSGLMFLSSFIIAGLNFRFSWLVLPAWVTILGTVLFLLAYALYAEVLRENEYLSRTIEVQEGQKVVDTGLYGIVRHPMYMATVLLFLSMPIILGSFFSFVIMLAYIPIIAKRIRNEEQVLEEGLAGYKQYKERVKYRIIPFVW